MRKLFGSKKQPEVPAKPALDMNNKDQLREMERTYKKQLQREMRELERGVLRKTFFSFFPSNSPSRERHGPKESRS